MKIKVLLSIFLLSGIWMGCSNKSVVRRYYVLELSQPAQHSPDFQFDLKVDVRDFRVARAFDQTRIALRTQSHELNYYFYHHWAVKPSQAVADFVYDSAESKNMFSRSFRGISYNPAFLITGEIKSIEQIKQGKTWFAHVHMLLELLDANSEKAVVQYEKDSRLELQPTNSMNTFAKTTSDILADMTDGFLEQTRLYLIDHYEKAAQ